MLLLRDGIHDMHRPLVGPMRWLERVALTVTEREFFIDNLLVRIHCIIVMIRWTGLAP